MKLTRNNWFLVVPTLVLGVAATITLYQMHGAGDVRTALQVVTGYQAEGKPPLGEYLAADAGRVEWDAEVVSSFYGTMDVTCLVDGSAEGGGVDGGAGSAPIEYRWRVDVGRHAFAPADEATKELMREYDPQIYAGDAPGAAADREKERP